MPWNLRTAETPAPWLLPVRAGQVAGWEVAGIAALLVTAPAPIPQQTRITVLVLASALVLATSFRVAGRHLAGWVLTWISYRLRQHDDRHDTTDPLYALAGDVTVHEHVDRAGNRFGVAKAGDGWTALVRLTGTGTPRIGTLVDVLRRAYADTDLPLTSAQLVVWTMPEGAGGAPFRVYWLAVRYRTEDAPIAALARGGGDLGAIRTTVRAALGLMSELAGAGYDSHLLDAAELEDELTLALGVDSTTEITDGWRSWNAGRSRQACYLPLDRRDLTSVLGRHANSAAFTAGSCTLRRTGAGKVREELAIRIGTRGDSESPDSVSRELELPMVPLNGRHAAYIRRTLPLALTD